MRNSHSLLLYGHDEMLTGTRAEVLRLAGYVVHTSASLERTSHLLHTGWFDLLIFCHTVPRHDAIEILKAAKKMPDLMQLLLVAVKPSHLATLVDHSHQTGDGPAALIAKVRHLLQERDTLRAKSRRRTRVTAITAFSCEEPDTQRRGLSS